MLGISHTETFSRGQVCRLLSLTERRLRNWEQLGLIARAESFGFDDIVALRTLEQLRKSRVSTVRIRRMMTSLREKLGGVQQPLSELKVFIDGRRIGVQVDGSKMEPISGQLLLDFDREELNKLLAFPGTEKAQQKRRAEAEHWFQKGLDLEASAAPMDEVIDAYSKAAELDPGSAGALVNLGTIWFNARQWDKAERYYRAAVEADPNYALAHFNLGNLCDERGDRESAMHHYQTALRLHPSYADAHYNLALVYQAIGQLLKAQQHWREYLKLDPGSSWAAIAKRELEKLRRASVIRGSGEHGLTTVK